MDLSELTSLIGVGLGIFAALDALNGPDRKNAIIRVLNPTIPTNDFGVSDVRPGDHLSHRSLRVLSSILISSFDRLFSTTHSLRFWSTALWFTIATVFMYFLLIYITDRPLFRRLHDFSRSQDWLSYAIVGISVALSVIANALLLKKARFFLLLISEYYQIRRFFLLAYCDLIITASAFVAYMTVAEFISSYLYSTRFPLYADIQLSIEPLDPDPLLNSEEQEGYNTLRWQMSLSLANLEWAQRNHIQDPHIAWRAGANSVKCDTVEQCAMSVSLLFPFLRFTPQRIYLDEEGILNELSSDNWLAGVFTTFIEDVRQQRGLQVGQRILFDYRMWVHSDLRSASVWQVFVASLDSALEFLLSSLRHFPERAFVAEWRTNLAVTVDSQIARYDRYSTWEANLAESLIDAFIDTEFDRNVRDVVPWTPLLVSSILTSGWMYLYVFGFGVAKFTTLLGSAIMPRFSGLLISKAPFTYMGVVLSVYAIVCYAILAIVS